MMIEEFPLCCGIGVLTDFNIKGQYSSSTHKEETLSQAQFEKRIWEEILEWWKSGYISTLICAFPNIKEWHTTKAALKKMGFVALGRPRSRSDAHWDEGGKLEMMQLSLEKYKKGNKWKEMVKERFKNEYYDYTDVDFGDDF